MNPIWGMLFKDRFRTPFSVYRMSFAELIFLLALVAGVGAGIYVGAKKALEFASTTDIEVEE